MQANHRIEFELDHLFICTNVNAPEADSLVEFGLTEGDGNTHPGQGTANRRFFFRNGMIELLWLGDEREARGERIARTRLYERCNYKETGASPFGLCVRPANRNEGKLPFGCWEYRAPYLPDGMSLYLGENSHLIDEPLLVYLPFGIRPDEYPEGRRQPLEHKADFAELTSIRITLKKAEPFTAALNELGVMKWLSVVTGEEHLLEIGFDGKRRGRKKDFRPTLPLTFAW